MLTTLLIVITPTVYNMFGLILTAVMPLVRAVFAVLLIVTDPNVRDALAITQTFKMVITASDLSCGK